MRKVLERAYLVILAGMVGIAAYAFFTFKLDIRSTRPYSESVQLTNYIVTKMADEKAPDGTVELYVFSVGNISEDYNSLFVYTINQNVDIIVGDERVYSCRAGEKGSFLGSTGKLWNHVELKPDDAGKLITVVCEACFPDAKGIRPIIYFGENYDIRKQIIQNDALGIFLCMTIVIIGIVIVVTEAIKYHRKVGDPVLLYAGIFIILSGLWKDTQFSSTALLNSYMPSLSMVTCFCLMLAGIPYLLSVKAILQEEGKIWYVPIWCNLIAMLTCLLPMFFGYFRLKQTVLLICLSIALIFITVFYEIYLRWRKEGKTELVRLVFIETCACCFWFEYDAVVFVYTKGTKASAIGIIGVWIYLLVILRSTLQRSSRKMEGGVHAIKFAKLAFRDSMTGFFNRAAYAEHLDKQMYPLNNTVVVMFDLNNLKKYNDTYGHAKGDEYIKKSAGIIEDCFSSMGDCFRLGGDEFAAICPNIEHSRVVDRCKKMESLVESYNKQNSELKIGIAYGYAWYEESDNCFEDVIKRADGLMYQKKREMKQ